MVNTNTIKAMRLSVRGVVQGVGFRPFVYRLAGDLGLNGWVRNTSGSVEIEVEGSEIALNTFASSLREAAPPMARIEEITSHFTHTKGYSRFEIQESSSIPDQYQLVSPDIATCEECRQEIFDPGNRRYRYPFTNCTNCGPRFTIIEEIPYDRPKTTMNVFKMCTLCQKEYDDPGDRRFHAQPNACPVCGPQIKLADSKGETVPCDDIITKAAELLRQGKILALRGLGGFQLACDATNKEAVTLLRSRKRRPAKPFAVMLSGIEEIGFHCHLSPEETELLKSPGAPIVLLNWKRQSSRICDITAPNNNFLGVMLPYTPLHHILIRETGLPLIMTSGNISEEPIAKDNEEALCRLNTIADYFLLHNREIYARYDDSVHMVENRSPQVLRRARGFAPYPIFLPYKSKQLLACGGEEKNTFCLTRDKHAFLSQHIGDLENEETLAHFESTIDLYKKIFRVQPELIACDMHPDYLSSRYAADLSKRSGVRLVPVQHHHAHIVSCMVENGIESPVLGVSFDGTGYGTDGHIWGGEFLVSDYKGFQRAGHLEYVPMPGGAAAIRKPYRMALSYLYSVFGMDMPAGGLPVDRYDPAEIELIKRQLTRKINSPLTSSVGRLFDAVSALLGVCGEINYPAQAAIELEMLASDNKVDSHYPVIIYRRDDMNIFEPAELISGIVADIRRGIPASQISYKFHLAIAEMILEMCRLISKETGISDIALSGGVFQNRLLQKLTLASLKDAGYNVIVHHLVPCNDGGVSLGQAVAANFAGD